MFQEQQMNVSDISNVESTGITKLTRDLRTATATLSPAEARYLVDYYYQLQDDRIRAKNRHRAFSADGEPHEVITWLSDNTAFLEKQIAKALLAYAESDPVGQWCLSVTGVAGVITAGLLAHVDIEKCPTAGNIFSFAGIAPSGKEWKKGEKRPFNAKLKTLTWKIGESFVKVSNLESDFYGKHYQQAKLKLIEQNESGFFADDAVKILAGKKFGKDTEAFKHYSNGRLPDAHIHARAKRKAVQLFLSHFWEVSRRIRFPNEVCVKPYVFDHLGHAHYIAPPNF